jgi:cytochrome c biogenesis protein CcmG, thiol:disulfide interchange protein DsbE
MSRTSTTARAGSGSNRLVIALVGLAIVAFVGVVAVLSANEGADLPSLSEFAGTVDVAGEPIGVAYPEEGPDPAVGLPAPQLTMLDLDDQEVVLGAPGRAQVLVFLAHWCPVCDQELPVLRDVIAAGGVPDDVDLIFVATGLDPGRPNWPPTKWLSDAGLSGVTTVRDDTDGRAFGSFGLRAYPAWAVVDRDGIVQGRHQGLLPQAGIAELIDRVAG